MTGERPLEVDEQGPEPSGATTGGLATRFVGAPVRAAEPPASDPITAPTDPVTAPTDPVTAPTEAVTASVPAVTDPVTASMPSVTAPPRPPPAPLVRPAAPVEQARPVPPAPPVAPNVAPQEVGAPAAATNEPGDGTKLLRAGLVASTIGLCLLMFVGYVYFFSNLQEHREQQALLNQYTTLNKGKILTAKTIPEGSPAGVLTIPAIGLSQVMVEGTSATDLLKGPGLMPGTARPGSLGNAVIAGHRTIAGSPFALLTTLRPGDHIEVVTALGAFRYRVLAVGSARPGAKDPISPSRRPRLTLVTSGGTAASSGRNYVVAALVGTPNRAPVPRHPPTPSQRGLSGDTDAVLPSILWGLVLAAGLAVMFWAYWHFRGRHWSVYLLSTPIVLAVAFVWCENLIRLLPGTM